VKHTTDNTAPDAPSTPAKPWSSRSIGSRFQHSIFYALIRFGGRPAAYLLLRLVVLYYVLCRPSVRQRSLPYLTRRFPEKRGLALLQASYRLSLGIGEILVDRAALGILGSDTLKVSMSERAQLQALLREGKGLVLVTAHVGCWQVAMAALKKVGSRVNIVMHREEGDLDRQYFEHEGSSPYRIIDPAGFLGGTLEMMEVLKRGEILCIMGDRPMGSDSGNVDVEFLGAAVRFPFSPYKLAAATGAPVAIIFPQKFDSGSYRLNLAKVLRIPEISGRSAAPYRPYARIYAEALEEFVQQYPFQFFNFFDMWSRPEEGPAKQ
jgi:predicted LPLAT superfamily acyltransferase